MKTAIATYSLLLLLLLLLAMLRRKVLCGCFFAPYIFFHSFLPITTTTTTTTATTAATAITATTAATDFYYCYYCFLAHHYVLIEHLPDQDFSVFPAVGKTIVSGGVGGGGVLPLTISRQLSGFPEQHFRLN